MQRKQLFAFYSTLTVPVGVAAGLALGQKAVDAAHASDLPAGVLEIIDGSQKYAEGRGVRMEVQSEADVRSAVALAAIKMAN